MSACCFCFGKKNKKVEPNDISMRKESSDHYQVSIKESEQSILKSIDSSVPDSETHFESSSEGQSSPVQMERHNSLSHNISNLYFPCKDPFRDSSDLVISKTSNFDFLFELEASNDWEVKIDKPFACIMVRSGTPSHPDVPLMKAFFDMELNVEPEDMYDIIYNPEVRKKWDSTVGGYYEIARLSEDVTHYYMHNKAPWPFKDRDFVEIRYIRRRVNGDMEIYFTAMNHQDAPEFKDKAIRGETIIGGQIFRKRNSPVTGTPTLFVTTICQADMKGEVPKKALKVTLPSSVLKWYRNVKKQLQLRVNEMQ